MISSFRRRMLYNTMSKTNVLDMVCQVTNESYTFNDQQTNSNTVGGLGLCIIIDYLETYNEDTPTKITIKDMRTNNVIYTDTLKYVDSLTGYHRIGLQLDSEYKNENRLLNYISTGSQEQQYYNSYYYYETPYNYTEALPLYFRVIIETPFKFTLAKFAFKNGGKNNTTYSYNNNVYKINKQSGGVTVPEDLWYNY